MWARGGIDVRERIHYPRTWECRLTNKYTYNNWEEEGHVRWDLFEVLAASAAHLVAKVPIGGIARSFNSNSSQERDNRLPSKTSTPFP